MTGYDPNYTPEEDPLDEVEVLGTPIRDFGNFLFFGCMTILGLGIALFFVVGFGIVCGAPGNDCWLFD